MLIYSGRVFFYADFEWIMMDFPASPPFDGKLKGEDVNDTILIVPHPDDDTRLAEVVEGV